MSDPVHLIVTDEGDYGFSAMSPQLPGFVYARPTLTEFNRDLGTVLREIGAPAPAVVHEQRRFVTPEGVDYLIRIASDDHRPERLDTVWRLESMLATEQRHQALASATEASGEVVFVCAVSGDRLGNIASQMFEPQDAIVIAVNVADHGVWTQQLSVVGDRDQYPGKLSLTELGLTRKSTVGDLLRIDQGTGRRPALVLA